MKYVFLILSFTIFFTMACTRTSQLGQQTTPVTAPIPEKVETKSFGKAVFKGSGNEPFWSLQIDENHTLMIKSIDDHQFKLNAPITEITTVNDANATNLTADLGDGKVTIMLMENGCQDNMSGKKSSHALQVLIKNETLEKPVLYKGCGEFLDAYLVNNNWTLESINGKNITNLPIEKAPTLNINLLQKKVNGFAGCNTFFGAVEMEKGRLKFGDIGLTKKACKDNTTEAAIVSLLNDPAQKYAINKDGSLVIKGAKQTLTFKAVK